MRQLITPNPHIPCQPGWCLQYVRQAFNLPAAYPTATAAWEASSSKHRDRKFPAGVWVPVWFSLANEPAGHVALMAPDGSVYSTSDLGTVPHQHLDLSDLMNYYARYGMTLTYLGWTEDVAGYPVLTDGSIAAQGTITTSEDDEMISAETQAWLKANLLNKDDGSQLRRDLAYQNNTLFSKADGAYQNNLSDAQHAEVLDALGKTLNKDDGGYIVKLVQAIKPGSTDVKAVADALAGIIPAGIAKEVADELAARLVK
jgi:hypothetical protein